MQLAAEVAAGKHVLRSRSSVDVADGNGSVASTVAPLLVRVQALPKVYPLIVLRNDWC